MWVDSQYPHSRSNYYLASALAFPLYFMSEIQCLRLVMYFKPRGVYARFEHFGALLVAFMCFILRIIQQVRRRQKKCETNWRKSTIVFNAHFLFTVLRFTKFPCVLHDLDSNNISVAHHTIFVYLCLQFFSEMKRKKGRRYIYSLKHLKRWNI